MSDISIKEVLHFFRKLDLQGKIEMLNALTSLLNKEVKHDSVPNLESNSRYKTSHKVIDELYGAWEHEAELTEEGIMNRTYSDRNIDL